jgi:hypothetical protein
LIQPTNTNPEKPGQTDKSHKEGENHKQIIQKTQTKNELTQIIQRETKRNKNRERQREQEK